MTDAVFLVPGQHPPEVEAAMAPVLTARGHAALQARTAPDSLGTLVVIDGTAPDVDEVAAALIAATGGIVATPPIGPGSGAAGSEVEEDPATTANPVVAQEIDDGTIRVDRGPRVRLSDGRTITVRGRLLIGRDPQARGTVDRDADLLSVDDPGRAVSKTHLALDLRDGALMVEDLASTNGSSLVDAAGRERTLVPGSPVPLSSGDTIRFGDLSAEVLS